MRIIEWLMGGDMMKAEPTQPSQILRRTTIGSAIVLTILVPLFSLTGIDPTINTIFEWKEGIYSWGFAILFLLTLPLVQRKIHNAILSYSLIVFAATPFSIGLIDIGYRTIRSQMDASSLTIIMLGFLAIFLTLPVSIAEERKKFVHDMELGRFRKSLDIHTGAWDTGNNIIGNSDHKKPSILVRLLIAVGPAIGMGLSDVIGRANAILIFGIVWLAFGTLGIRAHLSRFLAYSLKFRRIEKEIGKPIFIAE